MTDIEKKLAFLLATSPYLDTVDGSYDKAAIDLVENGVVPVVRCKDCKYAYEYQTKGSCRVPISCENENAPWYTTEHAIFVEENGYCSYGDRMADDE